LLVHAMPLCGWSAFGVGFCVMFASVGARCSHSHPRRFHTAVSDATATVADTHQNHITLITQQTIVANFRAPNNVRGRQLGPVSLSLSLSLSLSHTHTHTHARTHTHTHTLSLSLSLSLSLLSWVCSYIYLTAIPNKRGEPLFF
jgi:hypothetical protein